MSAADILGKDTYPLADMINSNFSSTSVNEMFAAAQSVAGCGQGTLASWMVPQCCNISYPNLRSPTLNELLFFSYQALVNGARGLIYFYYPWLTGNDGAAEVGVVGQLGAHLTQIEPIVLADDAGPLYTVQSSDSRIKTCTRSLNGRLYVITVNSSNDTVNTTFTLSGSGLKSAAYGLPGAFTNALVNTGSSYNDQLSPMQTRIYELVLNN